MRADQEAGQGLGTGNFSLVTKISRAVVTTPRGGSGIRWFGGWQDDADSWGMPFSCEAADGGLLLHRVASPCVFHPPGPCPCRANWTRCSGVKSVNRRFGTGGRSGWPGGGRRSGPGAGAVCEAAGGAAARLGSKLEPEAVSVPGFMFDGWMASARRVVQANHNPAAASSAASARNRSFRFSFIGARVWSRNSQSFGHGIVRGFSRAGF